MEIISRKEAKEQGLKRYFTGKPCKRGHISERRVGDSTCCACSTDIVRKNYEQNKEEVLEQRREYYEQNKDRINKVRRKKYKQNKEKIN